jgi:PIN domain nuclease of toxin-antitoxin system
MRLLLDTHVLLWALSAPKHLSKKARSEIENPANDVMFSAASIWEIAIKWALKRSDFRVTPGEISAAAIESGLRELPVRSTAAAHVAALPAHHRDPFDRLLIAQAVTEPAILYTTDPQLEIYSELVHRIQ